MTLKYFCIGFIKCTFIIGMHWVDGLSTGITYFFRVKYIVLYIIFLNNSNYKTNPNMYY